MKRLIPWVGGLLLTCFAATAMAQNFPNRQIRMIVPFPPGGTTDIMARILAEQLQASMGQPVVVENRAGAGGVIGTEATVKAPADGYTIMLSSSAPLAVGLKLYQKVPYDVMRDLTPVSMVGDVTMVLTASNALPARDVKEMIAFAKSKPGALNLAIPALGSQGHLLTELFRVRTGADINIVPYKGSGPAVVDLMAGVVHADFENLPAVVNYIRDGRLRALAVLSEKRLEILPDVPTFRELGMPEFVASPWFAIVAPAGTPAPIVQRLNSEINKALAQPTVKAVFEKNGANPVITTPEQTATFFRAEIDKWAGIVAETGATLR